MPNCLTFAYTTTYLLSREWKIIKHLITVNIYNTLFVFVPKKKVRKLQLLKDT